MIHIDLYLLAMVFVFYFFMISLAITLVIIYKRSESFARLVNGLITSNNLKRATYHVESYILRSGGYIFIITYLIIGIAAFDYISKEFGTTDLVRIVFAVALLLSTLHFLLKQYRDLEKREAQKQDPPFFEASQFSEVDEDD